MRSIEQILKQSKNIAIVGLSPNPERPSYGVGLYLQQQGYRVIPVNPTIPEVLGEKSYPSLSAIPEYVDMVDIFRRVEDVPPIVDEAIAKGARVVWMQEGIVHEGAARKAQVAGLDVVMDRCTMKEHKVLKSQGNL
ncbi:MAG: CoA-binding protein [Chloroflexi bacterium]|nr:CoA-binding protein [Chloroflexota bacterium]